MKTQDKRRSAFAMIILLLVPAIGLAWFFTRDRPDRLGGLASASAPRTKSSERSAPDPAHEKRRSESISLAARKWYGELLEKYPQMKPAFRNVPDEQNGFLQFLLLAESLKEPKLPEDLIDMLRGDSPWDPGKFKAWLAENKGYFDQILHIAELPDHSIKGLDFGRLAQGCGRFSSEFGHILNSSARLAFEAGDQESALRYGKASMSLSSHFTDIEVPSVLGAVLAAGIRMPARDSFVENMLPGLSKDPQALASWRDVLFRQEKPAGEYARVLAGEWNTMVRTNILPALLGSFNVPGGESFQIPDNDTFFDAHVSAFQNMAAGLSDSGPDRLDLSHAEFEFSASGTDESTRQMLHDSVYGFRGIFQALGVHATRTAMSSAAVAILLGEEPPVDPVSGKPFQWDPETRTLALPEGAGEGDSIKVP